MEYEVRAATEQDLPAILDLFELSLGTDGGAPVESFWRWKHIDNPFGNSPVLLAFDKDKLIGLRAFMRWRWELNDKFAPAFRAVDTATHPDYRGKGIFSKLTKALIHELKQTEPCCFIYNTPNTQSKPGYLKMGWKVLGKPNVVGSIGLAFSGKALENFEKFRTSLQEVDFDDLPFKSASSQGLVHTHHSLAYFRWRYQLIPEIPYGSYVYEGKKRAIMVFFHLKKRGRFYELRICDEIWSDGVADSATALKAYHSLARKLGTPVISFIPNYKMSLMQTIAYRIFSLKKYAPEITIREVNDAELITRVEDINNWSFNLGDLELF
ncbi:GNAT family N-acetyltransferase [Pontibacter rugosus]|uniref:GNAT family N-acetyltransferase n=1 Tax=Pontibacter rugosus TaxID=1745966 RepID=A0ABW3SX92_9BACT